MKPLNPIERVLFNALNEWRRDHGLIELRDPEDAGLEADADEPDGYADDVDDTDDDLDEAEDHRLDDPRHGQADEINRQR